MKTTYVYKKGRTGTEFNKSEQESTSENDSLVGVYLDLRKVSSERAVSETNGGSSNIEESISNSYEEIIQKTKPEKKKGSKKPVIIIVLLAVVVVIVLFIVQYMKSKELEEGINSLNNAVSMLYTDGNKTDVILSNSSELGSIYDTIAVYEEEGAELGSLRSEVDNISQFITDKAYLEVVTDAEYNIASDEFMDTVKEVENNVKYLYTEQGLAETIRGMCSDLLAEYDGYVSLKELLDGVTDLSMLPSDIDAQIQTITHTLNRDELLCMVELIESRLEYEAASVSYEPLKEVYDSLQAERAEIADSTRWKDKKRVEEIDEELESMMPEYEPVEASFLSAESRYNAAQEAYSEISDIIYGSGDSVGVLEGILDDADEGEDVINSTGVTEEVSE